MSPTSIAAYIVLFGSVGLLFLLVSLLLGRLLRPAVPAAAKLDVYECGEPAVGTSFIQFDLRFYVIALVFIVFEVEVALFFPPAVIYGTATRWMRPEAVSKPLYEFRADIGVEERSAPVFSLGDSRGGARARAHEQALQETSDDARWLALASAADLAVFFAVILLGFAYVWLRGDLTWVRAFDKSPSRPAERVQVGP